jgi:hypothetical protein
MNIRDMCDQLIASQSNDAVAKLAAPNFSAVTELN